MEDDWRPPEARVRAALWEAERWLRGGAYAAAGSALEGTSAGVLTRETADVVRGLRLLAAAGYRYEEGDEERSRRLLDKARAQLAPHLPSFEEVDLAELVELVAAAVRS